MPKVSVLLIIVLFTCAGMMRAESRYGFVPPPAAGVHPRICLTPSELSTLRDRAKTGPAQKGLQGARSVAIELANPRSSSGLLALQLRSGQPLTSSQIQLLCGALRIASFAAYVTAEPPLLSAAKGTLINIVNRVSPTELTDYSVSAPGIAFAYDWLYDSLTVAERQKVHDWLVMACRKFAAQLDNQVFGFKPNVAEQRTFNWIGVITGAFGLTALSIEGEAGYDPTWFQKAAASLMDFLEYGITPEGAPLETIHYFSYGMTNGAFFLNAMARRGYKVFEHPHLKNVPLWWAYDLYPWGKDFNDLQDTRDLSVGVGEIYYLLNFVYRDNRVMQWVYGNYLANLNGGDLFRTAPVLWGGPPFSNLDVRTLNLPLARYFSTAGLVYTRSGWGGDDLYLEFQSDPVTAGPSHSHSDRNSFTLASHGRLWITDGGGWLPQDIFHNLVLIDGKGEGYPPQVGKIVSYSNQAWATMITGDATNAYNWAAVGGGGAPGTIIHGIRSVPYNPVKQAIRSIVLLRGTHPYVLVADNIQKDDSPHSYSWRVLSPLGNSFLALGPGRALLTPTDSGATVQPNPVENNNGRQAPLVVHFSVKKAGDYSFWLLIGRDYWTPWNDGGWATIDQNKPSRFFAQEGDNARIHWQLFKSEKGEPVTMQLSEGQHQFSISPNGNEIHFAALLVVPKSFNALTPGKLSIPNDATLVRFADLSSLPSGWQKNTANLNEPQLLFQLLNPTDINLTAAIFERIRPDNHQNQGPELLIDATVRTISPRFRVVLYPHRENDVMPKVVSSDKSATISWPDGITDTFVFSDNVPIVSVDRRTSNGSSYKIQ